MCCLVSGAVVEKRLGSTALYKSRAGSIIILLSLSHHVFCTRKRTPNVTVFHSSLTPLLLSIVSLT